MDNSASHTSLVVDIIAELGKRPDVRVWHQKQLHAVVGRQHIHTGVKGMADISGLLSDGRRLEIEVKTGRGRLSEEQASWRAMIVRFGGVYVLARSLEDAIAGVEQARGVAL